MGGADLTLGIVEQLAMRRDGIVEPLVGGGLLRERDVDGLDGLRSTYRVGFGQCHLLASLLGHGLVDEAGE